jgi:hypothetical protein
MAGSEFAARSFYDVPLTGIRAFSIYSDPWLVRRGDWLCGAMMAWTWKPGENVAACSVNPAPPHEVAAKTCGCGFHAYFDGHNSYMEWFKVAGIIEGYGLLTVGTRGFRASKARIVALIQPQGIAPDRTRFRYPDKRFNQMCRQHYPNVPVYPTEEAALKAHPLTPLKLEQAA